MDRDKGRRLAVPASPIRRYESTIRTGAMSPSSDSSHHTLQNSPTSRQFNSQPPMNVDSCINLDDGIDRRTFSEQQSVFDGTTSPTEQDARTSVSGDELWNNIEGNEGDRQGRATSHQRALVPRCVAYNPFPSTHHSVLLHQGWPQQHSQFRSGITAGCQAVGARTPGTMPDDPGDVFGSDKMLFDTGSTACDRSYATSGAFNEEINHLDATSSAGTSTHFCGSPSPGSRDDQIYRPQRRSARALSDNAQAILDPSLMEHVERFSAEVNSTDGNVTDFEHFRPAAGNPTRLPPLAMMTSSPGVNTIGFTVDRSPHAHTLRTPPASENIYMRSNGFDRGVLDIRATSFIVPPLTPDDTRMSTSSPTSSRPRSTPDRITCPDCPNHRGFIGKNRKNNLRRHRREQHSNETSEKFECVICSHSTICRGRRRHLENEHQMSLPPNPLRRPPWGELKDTLDRSFVRIPLPEVSSLQENA